MDKILFIVPITETRAFVQSVHHMPDDPVDGLTEAEKIKGIRVPDIPQEPPTTADSVPQLYINPQTLEMWYEMRERPVTKDSEVEELKAKLAQAETDNLTALEAIAEVYEMVIGGGV